jgi:hypothetical protein
MCHVAECQQPQHQDQDSSYSDFLATHPSIFSDATDSLEVGSWLCMTESKFSLLHCREYQKTLYAVQQLRGLVGAWWASYTAVLLLITTPHGVSSTPTSALITYLWVCSTASSKSSWTSSKETTQSLTTPSSSIPLPNMGHTTMSWKRRKPTSTTMGLPSNYKTAWFNPPTCPTMIW